MKSGGLKTLHLLHVEPLFARCATEDVVVATSSLFQAAALATHCSHLDLNYNVYLQQNPGDVSQTDVSLPYLPTVVTSLIITRPYQFFPHHNETRRFY